MKSTANLFLFIILLSFSNTFAQVSEATTGSPHAVHQKAFVRSEFDEERDYDKEYRIVSLPDRNSAQKCALKSQVYGWHPAWRGSTYNNYDFGLLSTIGYFGYDVDPATGGYTSIHQWRESQLVEVAHAKGSRVELTATNFGAARNRQLLRDTTKTQVLVDSLLALIAEKDADGICIDFEGIPKDQRANFTAFIRRLSGALHRAKPYYELTLVVYAVDWGQVFDIPALNPLVDRFVIMAYDYHWSGAPVAGPVAPLANSKEWGQHSVSSSIDYYLTAGASREKTLLGVPYYGYMWNTSTENIPGKTTDKAKTVLYADLKTNYRDAPLQWDTASSTSYASWLLDTTGSYAQMWVADQKSLSRKYQLVKKKGIAGIGIWALGYDHGQDELWELIRDHFADCDAMATQISNNRAKVLDGKTSAERNKNNWIWILVGMGGFSVILILLRRMK